MRYLNKYQDYNSIFEWSKNDPMPEITKSTEKLAIFLMGSPAAGKCLEYNTNIHFSSGSVEKIGEFIESKIDNTSDSIEVIKDISDLNIYVQSLDSDFNIINNKISTIYRGYADELVNIKTQTGVDIKLTKTHPLLVLSENGDIGWKEAGLIEAKDKIATPRFISNNTEQLDIPEEYSRLIGYILGNADTSTTIEHIVYDDFNRCILKDDSTIKLYERKDDIAEIPGYIFNDKTSLMNLIGAYFSASGVILDKGVIEMYSTSKRVIEQLSYALLKLGILTSIRSRRNKLYIIEVLKQSNDTFFNTLNKYISSNISELSNVSSNIGMYKLNQSLIDLIAINNLSEKVQKIIGKRYLVTDNKLSKLISLFEEHNILDERVEYFNNLYSNILFDVVTSVNIQAHNDFVYDIVLESNHNFVGGNKPVVLHNSTFIKNFIHTKKGIKSFSSDDVSLLFTKDANIRYRGSGELNLRRIDIFMKSGQSFIYDTTPSYSDDKVDLIKKAREHGYKIMYIALITPLDIALKRNKERNTAQSTQDFLKYTYDTIWDKLNQYRELNPDIFYIITDLDNQYTFYKYDSDNKTLLKRKGFTYQ